jgi:gluconate 2-dehydrogenase gamma chain
MDRREALRLLAMGTALQLAPRNLLAVSREARTLLATQVASRTLNPHQDATVKAMTELILPKTDTLGATDAGVSEFIDLMLTEWYDEQDRTRFLNGLSEVDLGTKAFFGKDFVEGSPDQQAEILAWLGEKMTAEADAMGAGQRQRPGSPQKASAGFYPTLRRLTLTAYYTSEAGATEELHFQVLPDSHEDCATIPSAKGGEQN